MPRYPRIDYSDLSPEQIVATRQHFIYENRFNKLRINLLALQGGRPYIKERLSRFPGESHIDWDGTVGTVSERRFTGTTIQFEGRKQRAYLVNHAARVAEKIRQYVFAKPPERVGVPQQLERDITRRGDSLNAFMGDALRYVVAGRWCWIGIDAPRVDGVITLADQASGKVRPYWNLYSPLDVVDWKFDDKGELKWLITETKRWDNGSPYTAPQELDVRRLWEPGKVTEFVIDKKERNRVEIVKDPTVTAITFDQVPFVLVGDTSEAPHWYDDVEDIQRAILDLESSLDTLFFKCVFGQLVLPRSVADDFTGESAGGADLAATVAAIVGYANAILEGADDRGITRYIGPQAGAIKSIQDELQRKREILFDTVGLHLGFGKNYSESKEAKEYDNLDPQAVLRNYAQQVAEAENKAWQLTNAWDKSIPVADPKYADKFRVTNIYEDLKALTLAQQMDMPESMQRLTIRGVLDAVLEITNLTLTKQQYDTVVNDIEQHDFMEPIDLAPSLQADSVVNGVKDQATDDGEGLRASGAET